MGKHVPGPKELQRIALREKRYQERGPGSGTLYRRSVAAALPAIKKQLTEAVAQVTSKPTTAPVPASAPTQEKTMKKNRSVKRVKKAKVKTAKGPNRSQAAANLKAAKAKAPKVAKEPKGDGENKTGMVVTMLLDAKGCTAAEICTATGWAAVSVPPIAKRAGVELRKETEGRSVRYFGTRAAA